MSLPSSADAWLPNAEREYERVKPIANGAYGKVWVAKRRRQSGRENGTENRLSNEEVLVAVKVIFTSGHNGRAYADREVMILREMDHPYVVNLIKTYDDESTEGRVVVMTLANGPSLHSILERGGALGLPLSRLVSRHLIAAVSYLHSRAILHRDIKPQNLILHVPGCFDWECRDIMWSDDEQNSEILRKEGWKVVLVDLGFARALTKDEIETNQILGDNKPMECLVDDLGEGGLSQSMASRVLLRSMSALGSRVYAAPEVIRARKVVESDAACLAEFSANYTFLCDEYACGKTLLEVLSGVPASERDINEHVKQERLAAYISGQKDKKRFRLLHEIPRSATNLIRDLTRPSAKDRITCWVAQLYPWICGEKGEGDTFEIPTVSSVSYRPGDNIVPLGCDLRRTAAQTSWGARGVNAAGLGEVGEVMKIQVV